MLKRFLALTAAAVCCLAWQPAGYAQETIEADFETTFPSGGYAYDFSGYGGEGGNVVSDEQVSSTISTESPAAMATFDTSAWAPDTSQYTYAGWGLGLVFDMAEDRRPLSGDLSLYTLSFDASVVGYDPLDDGLSTAIAVIFQSNVTGGNQAYRIEVTVDPLLTTTPQTLMFNLADLEVTESVFDFPASPGDAYQVLVQLQPNTNAAEIGFDNDNVITLDNVVLEGPFAAGGVDGDFNGDTVVDGQDFLIWQRGESPEAFSPGDLDQWKAGYGAGGGGVAAASAIPEPASAALLAGAMLALAMTARRRRPR